MVNASVLDKYKKKYEVSPPPSVAKAHKGVRESLKDVNERERWLNAHKPSFIMQKPMHASPPTTIALTTLPDNLGSLASIGSRLKQLEFLGQNGLSPPPDILNLDAWLIGRLQELRAHVPLSSWTPSLANWLALNPDQKGYVLNAERSVQEFNRLKNIPSLSIPLPPSLSASLDDTTIPSAFSPLSSLDFTELRPVSARRASHKASDRISETFSGAGTELGAGRKKKSKKSVKPKEAVVEEIDNE
jgi:hypothetical protein